MYSKYIKRLIDLLSSGLCIIILSPLIVVLAIVGAIFMGGNPFFFQERPGKDERIFKLIKFRTMDNRKDKNGKLLPDDVRLNKYGRFLRKTSLDELPELINIFIGDMSFVGPRPLMVRYLPYYTDEERHRHDVRPGLTGYAQANGRNSLTWDERFKYDLYYVENVSFGLDCKILADTVKIVFHHTGIEMGDLGNLDDYRQVNKNYERR